MSKILVTNNTALDVLFVGAQIRPTETREYSSYAINTLLSDDLFLAGVANGDFTVSDGTRELPADEVDTYLSSLTSGKTVINIKDSQGYVSTGVTTSDVADTFTINPLQANNWILTVTDNTVIQIATSASTKQVMTFNLTIAQDDTGFHKVTFVESTKVSWSNNRSSQMPVQPTSTLTLTFTSVDYGVTWQAQEKFRWDAPEAPVGDLYDSDNTRRTISSVPTTIGVSIVSSKTIATGSLYYRILANSTASTAAEVVITVDGNERHTLTTPSFYQDQLVTQDIPVDESWNIKVGSIVEIFFRELSGALTIQVKGDVQESILSITNIVEGVPIEEVGVTSTDDVQVTTSPTAFGLTWANDTGDGFLSASARLDFNVNTDLPIQLNIAITVDDIIRYQTVTDTLQTAQRLNLTIPVDESWLITADSVIEVFTSVSSAGSVTTILGSIARSELMFSDIVPGTPVPGTGEISGSNNQDVVLVAGEVTTIIDIPSASTAITEGTASYAVSLKSPVAASGCITNIVVDGVVKYTRTWSGIFTSVTETDTVPVDATWGINAGSHIQFTCKETSAVPAIVMTVEGATLATMLTITSV